ncbi:MAG: choice-of-anchor D domain-containing protein [Myxococcota bacterium]|nr:choice-of-anchor D domain-containing protein [Myxococcota bacterium]
MSRLSAAALILLTGCIEQTFNTAGEAGAGSGAEIEVVPGSLSFGPLSSDDDALIKTVLIRSIGVADLTVEEITVSGTGAESFTLLTDSTRFVLPPGGEMALEVAFLPMGASEQAAVAIVSSNADLQPTLPVSLSGEGLVSELAITPSPLDFGAVGVGCDALENVTLENVGTEPLTISDISTDTASFALTTLPTLPLDLAPGESTGIRVTFTPGSETSFVGTIAVDSTEPMGTRTAEQLGEGVIDGSEVTDTWEMPVDPPTDILFSLDSSCSMTWDIWEMYNNFDAFINELEDYSEDWHIIVANEDSGCNNSGILTPTTPDYTEKFQEALFAWNLENDYTEALLTVNDNAVQNTDAGDCNAGFMRPQAMLHIIDITDEPEQSPRPWDEIVDSIVTKKGSLALTTISAIAGDYPSGCDDAAAGTGYYEAVDATSGVFLSICQSWATTNNLGLLASASVNQDTFELSQPAQESTIVVEVNGQRQTSGWSYDAASNAVIFASNLPGEGDAVSITYTNTGSCEG